MHFITHPRIYISHIINVAHNAGLSIRGVEDMISTPPRGVEAPYLKAAWPNDRRLQPGHLIIFNVPRIP